MWCWTECYLDVAQQYGDVLRLGGWFWWSSMGINARLSAVSSLHCWCSVRYESQPQSGTCTCAEKSKTYYQQHMIRSVIFSSFCSQSLCFHKQQPCGWLHVLPCIVVSMACAVDGLGCVCVVFVCMCVSLQLQGA